MEHSEGPEQVQTRFSILQRGVQSKQSDDCPLSVRIALFEYLGESPRQFHHHFDEFKYRVLTRFQRPDVRLDHGLFAAERGGLSFVVVLGHHLVEVGIEQGIPALLDVVVAVPERCELRLSVALLVVMDILQSLAELPLNVRIHLDGPKLLDELRLQAVLADVLAAALHPPPRPAAAVVDVRRTSPSAFVVLRVLLNRRGCAALAADKEAAVRELLQFRARVAPAPEDFLTLVEGRLIHHGIMGTKKEFAQEGHDPVVERIGENVVEDALVHFLAARIAGIAAGPQAEPIEGFRDLIERSVPACQQLPALLEERESVRVGDEHGGLLFAVELVSKRRQEAPLVQDPHLVMDALLDFLGEVLDLMPSDGRLNAQVQAAGWRVVVMLGDKAEVDTGDEVVLQ